MGKQNANLKKAYIKGDFTRHVPPRIAHILGLTEVIVKSQPFSKCYIPAKENITTSQSKSNEWRHQNLILSFLSHKCPLRPTHEVSSMIYFISFHIHKVVVRQSSGCCLGRTRFHRDDHFLSPMWHLWKSSALDRPQSPVFSQPASPEVCILFNPSFKIVEYTKPLWKYTSFLAITKQTSGGFTPLEQVTPQNQTFDMQRGVNVQLHKNGLVLFKKCKNIEWKRH